MDHLANEFYAADGWQKKAIEIIEKISIGDKRISDKTALELNNKISESSLKEFKKFTSTLEKSKEISLKQLKEFQRIPPRNCLLFFGTIGTGKSNLKSSIVPDDKSITIINSIERSKLIRLRNETTKYIEENTIKEMLCGNIASITHVHDEKPVYIVVDTIESTCERFDISISNLLSSIEDSTRYKNVKWIILSGEIANIFQNPLYEELSRYQFETSSHSSTEQNRYKVLNWFDLDKANISYKVSSNIWKAISSDKEYDEINVDDINYLPPAVIIPLFEKYEEGLYSENSIDVFELLVENLFQRLGLDSVKKNNAISAIKSLKLYTFENESIAMLLSSDGTLALQNTTSDSHHVNSLIEANLISQSSRGNEITYKVQSILIWAFYLSCKMIEDDAELNKLNLNNTSPNQLSINVKLIYQHLLNKKCDSISIEKLLTTHGTLDGSFFLLSYNSKAYRILFLKSLCIFLNDNLTMQSKILASSVSNIDVLTLGLYKIICAIDENDLSKELIDNIATLSSAIFKSKLSKSNTAHYISVIVHLMELINESTERITLIIHTIHRFTSLIRVNADDFEEEHSIFLLRLGRILINNLELPENNFLKLILDDSYKKSAWEGFYRLATKYLDAGFTHYLAKDEIVYSSVEINDHESVTRILEKLIQNDIYSIGYYDSDSDKKYKFHVRSAFHKAIGNRIRRVITMMTMDNDDAINLASRVIHDYKRYIGPENNVRSRLLNEGLLYIFRHIDISRNKEKSALPMEMRKIVNDTFGPRTTIKHFQFIGFTDWESRVNNMNRIFSSDYD